MEMDNAFYKWVLAQAPSRASSSPKYFSRIVGRLTDKTTGSWLKYVYKYLDKRGYSKQRFLLFLETVIAWFKG